MNRKCGRCGRGLNGESGDRCTLCQKELWENANKNFYKGCSKEFKEFIDNQFIKLTINKEVLNGRDITRC